MADRGTKIEFPVAEVEGAHCGREVHARVVERAAVGPIPVETGDFIELLANEQIACARLEEVEGEAPAVVEERRVETGAESGGLLPFKAVVADIVEHEAEGVAQKAGRCEVGFCGVIGEIIVTGELPAQTQASVVEPSEIFHPFFGAEHPRGVHRGEEGPAYAGHMQGTFGLLAEAVGCFHRSIDSQEVAVHPRILSAEEPGEVALLGIDANRRAERRRGVAHRVHIVGAGVEAASVGQIVGVVAEAPAELKVKLVVDAAQRGVLAVDVGDEGGVAVHHVLHAVFHRGVDFAVGVEKVYVGHAVVREEGVFLHLVEGIAHEAADGPCVVEAVFGRGIEVEAVVAAVALAEVENRERIAHAQFVDVGEFHGDFTLVGDHVLMVKRRLDHRQVGR